MSSDSLSSKAIYYLLKLGVIIFLLPFLNDFVFGLDFENNFPTYLVQGIIIVLFLAIFAIIIIINSENFNMFGFFLIFIASTYKILFSLFIKQDFSIIPIYFFLLIVSIYFMTKSNRKKRKQGIIY